VFSPLFSDQAALEWIGAGKMRATDEAPLKAVQADPRVEAPAETKPKRFRSTQTIQSPRRRNAA